MKKNKNLAIVRSVTDQGLTVVQTAERFHVSRQWVYTLLHRYHDAGPDALAPRSRAPRTRSHTTSAGLRDRIIALRKSLTKTGADAGAETIAWHLDREGHHVPSTSTIRRILHQAGLITPQPRKRPRSSYRRFQADLPNECWQSDITYWHLSDGTRVEILDFLDDHSRFLLYLRVRARFTGGDVAAALTTVIRSYGAPASTLTDNGMVFTARLARFKGARNGFEKLLQSHGIKQKNGAPGHPQTQGKVERFHQTLKRWLGVRGRPPDLMALQEQLDEFRQWYNTSRPHRAIGRRTPATAYEALPKSGPKSTTVPEIRPRVDRVDKNGKVSLRYGGELKHLGIGRKWSGHHVLILIQDREAVTSDMLPGEVIAEHTIDPGKDYQRPKKRTHATTPDKPHSIERPNPHKKA